MYNTLSARRHFVTLWRKGSHYYSSSMVLHTLPVQKVGLIDCHIGITCSSKVGGAIVRNKVKRRLRVLIRKNLEAFLTNYAYVIIARPIIVNKKFENLDAELLSLVKKVRASG